jgi:hypothetical protein
VWEMRILVHHLFHFYCIEVVHNYSIVRDVKLLHSIINSSQNLNGTGKSIFLSLIGAVGRFFFCDFRWLVQVGVVLRAGRKLTNVFGSCAF